jgi:hypothetical protein
MYPWHEMIWVWSVSAHKGIGVFCWYYPERFLCFPLYFVLPLLLLWDIWTLLLHWDVWLLKYRLLLIVFGF